MRRSRRSRGRFWVRRFLRSRLQQWWRCAAWDGRCGADESRRGLGRCILVRCCRCRLRAFKAIVVAVALGVLAVGGVVVYFASEKQ